MKHEELIKRIIAESHEPWMDEEDKEFFNAEFMSLLGAQLESEIEAALANGFTEETYENTLRAMIKIVQK